MNIKDILIVGVALAMDAFGVTISIGLNKRVNRSKKIGFIISFALFQFLFFFSGAIMGFLFEKYITAIPNIIGGTAIGIVGAMMIKEGFEKNENDISSIGVDNIVSKTWEKKINSIPSSSDVSSSQNDLDIPSFLRKNRNKNM